MSKPALWTLVAGAKKREVRPRKGLRKVSKAMAKKLRVYAKQRAAFLRPEGKLRLCNVCVELNCERFYTATQVHHRRGRGKYLLDESTWLPCCALHHDAIHRSPAWAKEHGYMLSRA